MGNSEPPVGRSDECLIVLEDEQVSRRHALIRGSADRAFIIDLDSSNGTFVGGRRVSTCPIGVGDEIRIGLTTLTVRPELDGGSATVRVTTLPATTNEIVTARVQSAIDSLLEQFSAGQKRSSPATLLGSTPLRP